MSAGGLCKNQEELFTKRITLIFKRFHGAEVRRKIIPSLTAVPASNADDG
jgi:hypothetical protein